MRPAHRGCIALALLAATCHVASVWADSNKTCMDQTGGCAAMSCQPQFGTCTKDGVTVSYEAIKATGTDVGTCGGVTGDCTATKQHTCVTDYCKNLAGHPCGEILCTVTIDVTGCL